MEIVKLPVGETAPVDSDCISIGPLPGGKFSLTGSLLADNESVAMVDGPPYATAEAAEAEGLAWAGSNAIEKLYIATEQLDGALG